VIGADATGKELAASDAVGADAGVAAGGVGEADLPMTNHPAAAAASMRATPRPIMTPRLSDAGGDAVDEEGER
jgi:hypothetical protein